MRSVETGAAAARRLCRQMLICVLLLGPITWPAQLAAQPTDAARFREIYLRLHEALQSVAPDMVV